VADGAEAVRTATTAARNDCGGTVKVVLLGPPGSGKGTQAAVLSGQMRVPAISTGDMLREAVVAKSELGQKVHGIMAAGSLVDDGTMAEVVRDRLARCGREGGFLLDGYPRTLPQAETLERILGEAGARLDAVLLVEVPEEELVRRTVARKREDDLETVVRERLRVYREKTAPLIGYYRGLGLLREIDGDRPVPEVTAQMVAALGLNLD
jgi:adenylate kinase